jgi:hypothetical protein
LKEWKTPRVTIPVGLSPYLFVDNMYQGVIQLITDSSNNGEAIQLKANENDNHLFIKYIITAYCQKIIG